MGTLAATLPVTASFAPPFPQALSLALPPAALAGANAIRLDLANRGRAACLVGVRLLRDDAAPVAGEDWCSSGVLEPLAADDRRWVEFPALAMGGPGALGDWGQATGLEVILARPKGSAPGGDLDVTLHGVEALALALPAGPRLSRAGLLGLVARRHLPQKEQNTGLDLAWSPVTDNAGPLAAPPLAAPLEPPALLLQGRIMGREVGFPPAWSGAGAGGQQWLHFLHRHHFLRPLALEYARTRDNALAAAVALAIRDWIVRHPAPLNSGGGSSPAWETLSAAWRLREWLGVIPALWSSRAIDDCPRSLILSSAWEHARHLRDHQGHPTNWALVEATALCLAGLRLDCFAEAGEWGRIGLQRLTSAARRQFLADGAHCELSPLYQAICLEALLAVRQALVGRGRPFPRVLADIVARGLAFLRALRRPDGTWPALNDAWGIDADHGAVLDAAAAAGHAPAPPPAPAGQHFRQAGICVLGGGPAGDRGTKLILRAGPAGVAHAHADALSLDVCLAGRPFVVDPGIASYDPSPLTGHYRSLPAHNLPTLEGWARTATGRTWRQRLRPAQVDLDFGADGELESATAVTWGPWSRPGLAGLIFRSVLSVSGDYIVVRDHFQGQGRGRGTRRAAVHWQFAPGDLALSPDGRQARLAAADGPVGWLVYLGPGPTPEVEQREGQLDPPGGWVAAAGRDAPAASLIYRINADLPLTMVWLLWPGAAAPDAILSACEAPSGALSLRINQVDGGWDELELGRPGLAARQPGGLRQGEVRLTRHRPGGRVVAHSVAAAPWPAASGS
ncbi:MAG: heparinase II/III family protein [Pseudomonadota bacterium]